MNGVHDLGGSHGHGPVVAEQSEPVFHHPWEGRVYAMMGMVRGAGVFNLDEMRHGIERMGQAEYLSTSYYEHWLAALEILLAEKGVKGEGPQRFSGLDSRDRPPLQPRFAVSSPVRTRNLNPAGHTRLPRYARGKRGRLESVHGPFLLPDANAHGGRDAWQPVYTVVFASRELWGEQASARDTVSIDLWEEYLEP